jgi:hypothetical protein
VMMTMMKTSAPECALSEALIVPSDKIASSRYA